MVSLLGIINYIINKLYWKKKCKGFKVRLFIIVGVYDDKFRPNETYITVRGAPSGGNAGVYSRMQMVKKVPNVILSQAFCTCCRNLAMVVAGSGESVSSHFIMSHMCTIGERSGNLMARAVVHHKEHIVSQQPYVDVHCPAEKAYHLPVEEMAVAWG